MKKMINNYESRINKFVLKMVETPVVIKLDDAKFSTTREQFLAKTSKKILDKKGFILTSHKTDMERINQIIKDKNEINKYIPKVIPKKREIKRWAENKLVQPSMRFTSRCDLERVFNIIKKRELANKREKYSTDQISKNNEYFNDESEDSNMNENSNNNNDDTLLNKDKFLTEEEKNKKMRHNKIIRDRKTMIAKRHLYLGINNILMGKKIKKDSDDYNVHYTKKFREDLYNNKTHFKALENLIMFKTSTMNHNLFPVWSKEDKIQQKNLNDNKQLFYSSLSKRANNIIKERFDNSKKYNSYSNKNEKNNKFDETENNLNNINDSAIGWGENKKIFKDHSINKELMISNPLLYNLNFNALKNEDQIYDELFKNKIRALKKLAFEKEKEESNETSNAEFESHFKEELRNEDNIVIDGEFYKINKTDVIADKLLTKCNWNEKRNKYKKKFGRGKLMFTGGLL